MNHPALMTLAGFDPSGGAGLQMDLKVFARFGWEGLSVVTGLTAQNSQGVFGVAPVAGEFVAQQMRLLLEDIPVAGIKIGMLARREVLAAVLPLFEKFSGPIVLDPVLLSSSGARLLEEAALPLLTQKLFPLTALITPNLPEAQALTGLPAHASPEALGQALLDLGAPAVLLKGGHGQEPTESIDYLITGKGVVPLKSPRLPGKNPHGTGCALASAILCGLAHGLDLKEACQEAKDFVFQAIQKSSPLGKGADYLAF